MADLNTVFHQKVFYAEAATQQRCAQAEAALARGMADLKIQHEQQASALNERYHHHAAQLDSVFEKLDAALSGRPRPNSTPATGKPRCNSKRLSGNRGADAREPSTGTVDCHRSRFSRNPHSDGATGLRDEALSRNRMPKLVFATSLPSPRLVFVRRSRRLRSVLKRKCRSSKRPMSNSSLNSTSASGKGNSHSGSCRFHRRSDSDRGGFAVSALADEAPE